MRRCGVMSLSFFVNANGYNDEIVLSSSVSRE